jgi:hypothetical protein
VRGLTVREGAPAGSTTLLQCCLLMGMLASARAAHAATATSRVTRRDIRSMNHY